MKRRWEWRGEKETRIIERSRREERRRSMRRRAAKNREMVKDILLINPIESNQIR